MHSTATVPTAGASPLPGSHKGGVGCRDQRTMGLPRKECSQEGGDCWCVYPTKLVRYWCCDGPPPSRLAGSAKHSTPSATRVPVPAVEVQAPSCPRSSIWQRANHKTCGGLDGSRDTQQQIWHSSHRARTSCKSMWYGQTLTTLIWLVLTITMAPSCALPDEGKQDWQQPWLSSVGPHLRRCGALPHVCYHATGRSNGQKSSLPPDLAPRVPTSLHLHRPCANARRHQPKPEMIPQRSTAPR